jgi:hypothetical protein
VEREGRYLAGLSSRMSEARGLTSETYAHGQPGVVDADHRRRIKAVLGMYVRHGTWLTTRPRIHMVSRRVNRRATLGGRQRIPFARPKAEAKM